MSELWEVIDKHLYTYHGECECGWDVAYSEPYLPRRLKRTDPEMQAKHLADVIERCGWRDARETS